MDFERYTDGVRQTVVAAQAQARLLGQDAIGSEHLLLAIAERNHGLAAHLLERAGFDFGTARRELIERSLRPNNRPQRLLDFTHEAGWALARAAFHADEAGSARIRSEHLLLALLVHPAGSEANHAQKLVAALGIDWRELVERVGVAIGGTSGKVKPEDIADLPNFHYYAADAGQRARSDFKLSDSQLALIRGVLRRGYPVIISPNRLTGDRVDGLAAAFSAATNDAELLRERMACDDGVRHPLEEVAAEFGVDLPPAAAAAPDATPAWLQREQAPRPRRTADELSDDEVLAGIREAAIANDGTLNASQYSRYALEHGLPGAVGLYARFGNFPRTLSLAGIPAAAAGGHAAPAAPAETLPQHR